VISLAHVPKPPLSDFVEAFWLIEGCVLPHGFERVMPGGDMGLVINLYEDRTRAYDPKSLECVRSWSGSLVCGVRTTAEIVDASELRDTMGVHFKPGGSFPFFDLPAGELRGVNVGLEELWVEDGRFLRERLLTAKTAARKFEILEQEMLRHVKKPLEKHRAVQFALQTFQKAPERRVASVVEEIGLSERRFIQVFADEVGLTPKIYCRLQRFQKALAKSFERRKIDWAEIALECGYFDQAHFIHDFTGFSGLTPTAYVAQRTQPGNHVPIVA
jgi:AraC-like DNA-binding protein